MLKTPVKLFLISYINCIRDYKANIDHQNIDGETALHFAVRVNRIDVVEFLLEKGINYKIINKKGLSAENTTTNAELSSLIIFYGKKHEKARKEEFKRRK